MPKFRLTLTYDYEANPEYYFDEVPEEITREVLQRMVDIDSAEDNIQDFIEYILETGGYEGKIEVVEGD